MICSHYLMDAHTFYYQAIVHQKKQVVPGRRSQLFQQDLLCNCCIVLLFLEDNIHQFVKEVAKGPSICKAIKHDKKQSSQLKLFDPRNLLSNCIAEPSQDSSCNCLGPKRMGLELNQILSPCFLGYVGHGAMINYLLPPSPSMSELIRVWF
uniref:Uncharacterized protein MANES_15G043600 n=1 Tax=Rhizophora mucronata TaxID=61149 RepID=A0A2P2K0L8_RHIMU